MLVVGTWLAENPHFARRILTDGHDLGNHTWSHPTLSDDNRVETRDEIARCRRLLTRLTGNAGTWFRPSGTQFATTLMLHEAGAAGYRVSLSYDVDPLDYTNPGSAVVTQRVLHEAKAGSIVSLHTLYAGTADAMPGLLSGLQDAGLRPVAASRLLRRSIT
jgi:peptidoglycan/xylan/chitin deacetylase (PgdA/CDA1 family)